MPYFFLLFIAIIQTILFLGHWFVYKTLVRALNISNPNLMLGLRWGLVTLSVSFVLASLLAFNYYNLFTRIFYSLAAGWLGILFFLLIACALVWVAYLLPINHKLFAQAVLVTALFAAAYSLFNAHSIRVTSLSVKLPNLPSSWQGKTAVWVSDAHLGQIWNYGAVKKITAQINALNPDIIFIGGDLYDGAAVDANKVIEPFAGLKAPQGKYFITGNHEQFRDDAGYLQAVQRVGIRVLDNELVNAEGLQIIGLDYDDSRTAERARDILKNLKLDKTKPSVLLKHVPNDLAVAEQAGINFQISGHTHRAQVWPFSYIPRAVYQGYDYGLRSFGKMAVYTSSGIGTWGPPIRFLTYPEIVQIRFE